MATGLDDLNGQEFEENSVPFPLDEIFEAIEADQFCKAPLSREQLDGIDHCGHNLYVPVSQYRR